MTASKFILRNLNDQDIDFIRASFHWQSNEQWLRIQSQNQSGQRITLLAIQDERVVGYANLVWRSDYTPFLEQGIPEINNMHILPDYQHQGIGTALIKACEVLTAQAGKSAIGIGVAQCENYAAAQRLYPYLGYIPDGRGLVSTQWGEIQYSIKILPALDI
jgi:GNAT superfamily N-acetyltransferase